MFITNIALGSITIIAIYFTVKGLQRFYRIQRIVKKPIDQIEITDAFTQMKSVQKEISIWYTIGGYFFSFLALMILSRTEALMGFKVFYFSSAILFFLVNTGLILLHVTKRPFQAIWKKHHQYHQTKNLT